MTQDSLFHQYCKIQADRLRGNQTTQRPSISTSNVPLNLPPPPAYTPAPSSTAAHQAQEASPSDSINDDEYCYYDDEETDSPYSSSPASQTTISVTAPVKITGHANILNTSSLASMIGSSVNTALQHQQQSLSELDPPPSTEYACNDGDNGAGGGGKEGKKCCPCPRLVARPVKLNINCAITISGSRNIVGELVSKAGLAARLSPAPPPPAAAASSARGTSEPAPARSGAGLQKDSAAVVGSRKRSAEIMVSFDSMRFIQVTHSNPGDFVELMWERKQDDSGGPAAKKIHHV